MKNVTRKLAAAGLLVALDIIFARFLSFYTPGNLVRVGPQFLAHALAGWLLGPVWALGSAVAGDLLGMLINSAGISFLPGYTLSAALSGLLYGLVLYRRPVRFWRSLLAVGVVTALVSLGLGALWSFLYFGRAWGAAIVLQLPWRGALLPCYASILYFVQRGLDRAKIKQWL